MNIELATIETQLIISTLLGYACELEKKSCSESCGPSDYYFGGKCHRNNCYPSTYNVQTSKGVRNLIYKLNAGLDEKNCFNLKAIHWIVN